jgi:hypothetical protein
MEYVVQVLWGYRRLDQSLRSHDDPSFGRVNKKSKERKTAKMGQKQEKL